jgi:hypothetical protein
MHEGTTIRVYELQGSFVELILVNFDPISLHDFFEHFPFQDVLRLEPIVSLFQSVYTTTFDHTASTLAFVFSSVKPPNANRLSTTFYPFLSKTSLLSVLAVLNWKARKGMAMSPPMIM